MGIFNRGKEIIIEEIMEVEEEISNMFQMKGLNMNKEIILLGILYVMVIFRSRNRTKVSGTHELSLYNLNTVNGLKDIFLGYLGSAMLDPIMTIFNLESLEGNVYELVVAINSLFAIYMWIYLVTDVFDTNDVLSFFRYHVQMKPNYDKKPSKYPWLHLLNQKKDNEREQKGLKGEVAKDASLWFLLICIAAACLPGSVKHTDVIHAYAIVFLWIILHHYVRKATSWGSPYIVTILSPSTALMPLEYCMPLLDGTADSLDWTESYLEFVSKRTNVNINIRV